MTIPVNNNTASAGHSHDNTGAAVAAMDRARPDTPNSRKLSMLIDANTVETLMI